MDKQKAIELLKQRSNEAAFIASLSYQNNEYIPWRRNIEDILEEAFGVTSSEYRRVAETVVNVTTRGNPTREALQSRYKESVHRIQLEINSIIQKYEMLGFIGNSETDNQSIIDKKEAGASQLFEIKPIHWEDIKNQFGVTKVRFGKRINFVKDKFKREIIFRDVEHSFALANSGYYKPAAILAGSVIEELLRLYLKHKNITPSKDDFDGYIKTCEEEGLLKKGIYHLSDSARHFRNFVHLSKEETKKHTISKSAAQGAVSSIFTIANDF